MSDSLAMKYAVMDEDEPDTGCMTEAEPSNNLSELSPSLAEIFAGLEKTWDMCSIPERATAYRAATEIAKPYDAEITRLRARVTEMEAENKRLQARAGKSPWYVDEIEDGS